MPEFGSDYHFAPPAAGRVVNGAALHGDAQHFFEAHRLRRELNIIVNFLALAAMFELDGKYRAARMKLHHIGLANQAEPVRPQRQRAFNLDPGLDFVTGRIDQPMHRLPTGRVNVIVEYLLDMNQRALARTVCVMLERGNGDGIGVVHAGGATIFFRHNSIAEDIMGAVLKDIEAQALQLPLKERGELAHRLIVSLDGEPEDSPEAFAQAWDEEIARRVAEIDAGTATLIPEEEVFAKLDAKRKAR